MTLEVDQAEAEAATAAAPAEVAGEAAAAPDGVVSAEAVPAQTAPAEAAPAETVPAETAPADDSAARVEGFQVSLPEFEGPFDLLLGLIAKHKLDVTTLALSKVTDEFIAYIRAMGDSWDLDQASEFLVIAATLLDLKAARLLPAAEVEDEGDLALLEARDLLFARLLQYKAYKQVANDLGRRHAAAGRMFPRSVKLEPSFADLLPEVIINLTPEQFAALAVKAMTPRTPPEVSVTHLHGSKVSVREQVAVLIAKMREFKTATFTKLCEDAPDTLTIVARFLGLLELFRSADVMFDQPDAFAELTVSWTGAEEGEVEVAVDEFDRSAPPEDDKAEPEAEDGAADVLEIDDELWEAGEPE